MRRRWQEEFQPTVQDRSSEGRDSESSCVTGQNPVAIGEECRFFWWVWASLRIEASQESVSLLIWAEPISAPVRLHRRAVQSSGVGVLPSFQADDGRSAP
jgi:hypothetical protein